MKNMEYRRNNKFILVMMVLVFCFMAATGRAAEKDKAIEMAGTKATALAKEKENDQETLCKKVAALIKSNKIDEYMPERKDFDPRGSEYLNVDIDGDGKADKIIVGSGSEGSFLEVSLSTGVEYDVDEGGFITIFRFEENVYAVVTYQEWNANRVGSKTIGYRLYKLTKDAAIIVCDKF
jgi:hypothetical protein